MRNESITGCKIAANAGISFTEGPTMVVAPGDEMLAKIWVVAPTTPIFSPPRSITTERAIPFFWLLAVIVGEVRNAVSDCPSAVTK